MVMNPDKLRRYTVGVLVSNEPGVLSRVSGLFSRRGFNIESLAVGPTQDREVSRITIVVLGDDAHIEQLVQQLYKLICVQKVQVLSNKNDVERQLLLVKVAAGVKEREGLMRLGGGYLQGEGAGRDQILDDFGDHGRQRQDHRDDAAAGGLRHTGAGSHRRGRARTRRRSDEFRYI